MNKEFEKIIEKLEEEKSGLTEWAEDEAYNNKCKNWCIERSVNQNEQSKQNT